MSTKKKLLLGSAGAAAAGGAGLDVTDVFSTFLYEGNGTANVIENGINLGQSNSGGGARFEGADTNCVIVPPSSDFGFGTGDYTIEFFVYKFSDKNYITYYDQRTSSQDATTASPFIYSDVSGVLYFYVNGSNRITGSGADIANGAWTHVAVCRSNGSTRMFVNGTEIGSGFADSINYVTPANNFSFGGSEEQSLYNVDGYMSNVRVVKGSALYTSNFTAPTSALTAVSGTVLLALQGDDPFTDNSSSSHALVNDNATASTFGPFDADEAGEGGLVWFKNRDQADPNQLYDTERGVTKRLKSDATDAEATSSNGLTAFNSNGFTIGAAQTINTSGEGIVSWTFRKAPKFFDCIQYSGTGTTGLVLNHDLNCEVGTVIIKRTDTTNNWYVHHRSVGGTQHLILDNTSAATSYGGTELTTSTTSITINMANNITNASGGTYIAYLFAHHANDGSATGFGPDGDSPVISCGSYTGTGSEMFVDLGFEPQFFLTKRTDSATDWFIVDVMRGMAVDQADPYLKPNATTTETNTGGNGWHPSPTGITIQSSSQITSGANYIYMAIRRGPLAAPESASDVFAISTRLTGPPRAYSGFPVDAFLRRNDINQTGSPSMNSRLTATGNVTDTNTAEFSRGSDFFANMTGVWNATGTAENTDYFWMWKRAPSYFDVVAYTGTGSAITINHNLGAVPEMIWVKRRDSAQDWIVYHSGNDVDGDGQPWTDFLRLDSTQAGVDADYFNDTAPTATTFQVKGYGPTGASGGKFIAYLFASLDGISKVGSFVADGNAQNIDCGFSSGARFVLIKKSSGTFDWRLWDSTRGIVAADDPYLFLNSNAAEATNGDWIDPLSSGFSITSAFSNGTYIFYAIA